MYFVLFFRAAGVKILDVLPAVSLPLYSFLIHVVRRLQRPELCLHWHNGGPLLLAALNCTSTVSSRRKKVEVVVTGHHMSHRLVGPGQLKSPAMLSDLLGIRMLLQPLI